MSDLFVLGSLNAVAAQDSPDLLGEPVARAVVALGLGSALGVAAIDASLSDTSATRDAYAIPEEALANCIVVVGSRQGVERVAACVVLADSRADVNGIVRKRLDVRKATFLAMDEAVRRTGMEYGGITPVGLRYGWPILVDSRVAAAPVVVVGSGIRGSKILVPGSVLAALPGAEVVTGLGRPIA